MAREMKGFGAQPKPTRRTKYQWTLWANGSIWLAKRGDDFKVTAQAFAMACRGYAKSRGIKVEVKPASESEVFFQFLPLIPPSQQPSPQR